METKPIFDTKKKLGLFLMSESIVLGLDYLEIGDRKSAEELIREGKKLFSCLLETKSCNPGLISGQLIQLIEAKTRVEKACIKKYMDILERILDKNKRFGNEDKNKINEIRNFAAAIAEIFSGEVDKNLGSGALK